ncbi:MAG: radical SAM protein [Deltaproteobacteria bacterium]|nr:radical SAM protein [Deltaproteobacteria bacterium]
MNPSYLKLYEKGILSKRVEKALNLMDSCRLCPRECGVNRLKGEIGFCKTGRKARVASYCAHFGEEGPLVGIHGSGTIFLSSCNLLCSFCQNYEISHLNEGFEVGPKELASMMVQLAESGCHNINFVTPTHVVPQLLEALVYAIERGLNIPLVYNTGGYDKKETLELLEDVFDIYMPDFKFWDEKYADRYCKAVDYRKYAILAILEMHRQVGDLFLDDRGIALKGIIIRHLVMPENVAGTSEIMDFIAREVSKCSYINLMDQYRPCGKLEKEDPINRRLSAEEFREALLITRRKGLNRLDLRDRMRLIYR